MRSRSDGAVHCRGSSSVNAIARWCSTTSTSASGNIAGGATAGAGTDITSDHGRITCRALLDRSARTAGAGTASVKAGLGVARIGTAAADAAGHITGTTSTGRACPGRTIQIRRGSAVKTVTGAGGRPLIAIAAYGIRSGSAVIRGGNSGNTATGAAAGIARAPAVTAYT